MKRSIGLLTATMFSAFGLSVGPAKGQSGGLVWCYEAERDLVRQMSRASCHGQIIDERRARVVQQRRNERILRMLRGTKPLFPGLKRRGSGGGTIVSKKGHILTNHHVIADCKAVSVVPFNAKEIAASVVDKDSKVDLALLKAAIEKPVVARFAKDPTLRPGDPIVVIGFPDHGKAAIRPVLVTGHVHIGGDAGRSDRFVLKVDVRPGNSGGPVLDRAGRVVGVVVAKLNTPAHYARTGALVHNVGVAINHATALGFLSENSLGTDAVDGPNNLGDADLLRRAQGFVARIGCWR